MGSKRRRILGPAVANLPDPRPPARITRSAARLAQTTAAVTVPKHEPPQKVYTIPDGDDDDCIMDNNVLHGGDHSAQVSAQLTEDIVAWSSTASRSHSRHVKTKTLEPPLSDLQPSVVPPSEQQQQQQQQPADQDDATSVMSDLSDDFYQDFKSDLCHDIARLRLPKNSLEASFSRIQTQSLRHTLRKWVEQDKASRALSHVYCRLDNGYQEDDFDAETSLLGRDLALFRTVKSLRSRTRVDLFVAFLEREEPEAGPPARDSDYLVRSLVSLDGCILALDLPLAEKNLVQTAASGLGTRDPACETALVLVPCDSVAEFLMTAVDASAAAPTESPAQDNGGLHDVIRYYADQCLASTNWDYLLPVFKEICTKTWEMGPTEGLAGLPPTLIQSILQASLHTRDWALFERAASHVGHKLPLTFFQWARAEVKAGRLTFRDIEKGMMTAVVSYADAYHKSLALMCLVHPEDDEEAQTWARRAATTICGMSHSQPLGERDGRMLVNMASVVIGLESFVSNFAPAVEINSAQVPFMFGVISELRKSEYRTDGQATITRSLLQKLARQTVKAIDISQLRSFNKHAASQRLKQSVPNPYAGRVTPSRLPSPALLEATTEPKHIADFIDCLLTEKMNDTLTLQLAFKIVSQAELIDKRDFVPLWLPFLRLLPDILKRHGIPLSTPRYRHIFAAILDSYILKSVGREPPRIPIPPSGQHPTSSFNPSNCGYSMCHYVSRFLAGTSQKLALRASQQQLAHLTEHCTQSPREPLGFTFTCEDDDRVVLRKPKLLAPKDTWGDWTRRKVEARRQIDQISAQLPEILGEEYQSIVELKSLDLHSSFLAEEDPHPGPSFGTGVAHQQGTMQRPSQQPFAQNTLPPPSQGNPITAAAVPLPPISSLHLPVPVPLPVPVSLPVPAPSHGYAHNTFGNVGGHLTPQPFGVGQSTWSPVTGIPQQNPANATQQQAPAYPGSLLSTMGSRLTNQPLGVSQPSPVARPPQQRPANYIRQPSHAQTIHTLGDTGPRPAQWPFGTGQTSPASRPVQQPPATSIQRQGHSNTSSTPSNTGSRLTQQPLGVSQPGPVTQPPQQSPGSSPGRELYIAEETPRLQRLLSSRKAKPSHIQELALQKWRGLTVRKRAEYEIRARFGPKRNQAPQPQPQTPSTPFRLRPTEHQENNPPPPSSTDCVSPAPLQPTVNTTAPPLPPATASPPASVPGYYAYVKELEPRLRKTHPSASADTIRRILARQYEALSKADRAYYEKKTGADRSGSSLSLSAAPMPSPSTFTASDRGRTFTGRPSATQQTRSPAVAASSPKPTFGGSSLGNRLRTPATAISSPSSSASAGTSRGAGSNKRKLAEFVDLTGDSD
ncbi:hypothetical protein B0T19DRAFT_409086 [Cercophora scortea]|uniref:Uncharacterized protein n=1 Tax=Cercophora scortea TaxID=314031 RepID=A0AAE0J3I2_9PEZI|nr:hypothetical protein B0T19DRAFT_409086 [Cercophora scortea]